MNIFSQRGFSSYAGQKSASTSSSSVSDLQRKELVGLSLEYGLTYERGIYAKIREDVG